MVAPKKDTPAPAGDITTWLDEDMRAEISRLRQDNARLRDAVRSREAAELAALQDLDEATAECKRLRGLLLLIITAYHVDSPGWVAEVSRAILRATQELNPRPRAALSTTQQPGGESGKKGAE